MSTVRHAIEEEIAAVLKEAGLPLTEFADSSRLVNGGIGLDSMDFAVLVVRLEQRFKCDPFNSPALGKFPTTLGDLVKLYEAALDQPQPCNAL